MVGQRTSARRVALILVASALIGGPLLFVARRGGFRPAWAEAARVGRELRVELRAAAPFTATAKALREYRANRNKWDALELRNYDYEFTAECFCGNAGRHVVSVVDGEVSAVVDADTGARVHAGDLRLYDTIDARFDSVRNAIRSAPDEYEVSYDPRTGVPLRIEFDFSAEAIDDEGWSAVRLLESR